jgi:hypothetical protein
MGMELGLRRWLALGAAAAVLSIGAASAGPGNAGVAFAAGSNVSCRSARPTRLQVINRRHRDTRRHPHHGAKHTLAGCCTPKPAAQGGPGCAPGSKGKRVGRPGRKHHTAHHTVTRRVRQPKSTVGSSAPTPPPQPGLSPPPGYTNQQQIFDDQFSGTKLDSAKWNTYLGDSGGIWDNLGQLPLPFSGPNSSGARDEAAMFGPSQVSVNNGLTLTARRNTNRYAGTYPWISGVVTTEGKFSLPTSGWYVQVKAEMPDQSQGMWPGIWFLPGTAGTPVNELDGYEGGLLGADPDELMHSDYFADQGQQQSLYSVGTDVSAGYHVYGFQFIPGQSITAFFDGKQMWQVSAANGITITGEPYEIILELQVAMQDTSGWHTVMTAATPPAAMSVAEVQAYSLPS